MQKQFCCSQWLSGKIQISFGNLITGNRAHQDILLWLKINILKRDKTSLSYCNVIMVVYKNSDLIGPFVIYNLHHFSSLRLYCTIVVIYATYRNCIQCWDSCFPSQLNIEKSRGGKIARMIYQLSWTQCKCPIKLTWIVVLKQILPYNVVNIQFTVFSLADVNECLTLGICDHKCFNTEGSFNCSCVEGYVLEPPQTCRPQGTGSCLFWLWFALWINCYFKGLLDCLSL